MSKQKEDDDFKSISQRLRAKLKIKNYFDLETYIMKQPDQIRPEYLRPGRERLCVFKSQVDELQPILEQLCAVVEAMEIISNGMFPCGDHVEGATSLFADHTLEPLEKLLGEK